MARNRMIKPEFWSSDTLSRVSLGARLTFIGVWNFCDDYGFNLNSTRSLLGDIYPCDEAVTEVKLKGWINELIEAKLLIPVEYKGKSLIFVKGWGEHQTVANKSKRAYIEPSDLEQVINASLNAHESLISVYLDSHAPKRKKKEKEERDKGFKKPTLDELESYCKEISSSIDPNNFLDFYESKGWMIGKNKVKDWKACVRTWERKRKEGKGDAPNNSEAEAFLNG